MTLTSGLFKFLSLGLFATLKHFCDSSILLQPQEMYKFETCANCIFCIILYTSRGGTLTDTSFWKLKMSV